MSEIEIRRPISIEIDTIETDSYLPSFKVDIKLEIKHPTGHFSYQANDIWFECSEWDKFTVEINTLNSKTNISLKLSDVSEYFNIIFIKDRLDETLFKVSINEPFSGVNGEGFMGYQSKIDSNIIDIINSSFQNFNRWW
jgi:hypothetical protein